MTDKSLRGNVAYTVKEFMQEYPFISRSALYEALKRGEIYHVRLGRKIIIPREPWERKLNGDASEVSSNEK